MDFPVERTVDAGEPFVAFRAKARAFCESVLRPQHDKWEEQGFVDHEAFELAAKEGLYCMGVPTEYGGQGLTDYRYNAIMNEECYRAGCSGFLGILGSDMVLPYLLKCASAEQRARWFPRIAAGRGGVLAIAMSEPEIGSDVAAVATTAEPDGPDHWRVNGRKMWISNGSICDLLVLVVRTSPSEAHPHRGLSLLVVERGTPGFRCAKVLRKLGHHARDVCQLEFEDVRVPRANLLGEEGMGFRYLMANLPQERLTVSVSAMAACELALTQTVAYARQRCAFGRPIAQFQHNSFKLADLKARVQVGRVFVDRCIEAHAAGALTTEAASMAKLWTTELQQDVLTACVQLHGAYGFLADNEDAVEWLRGVPPIGKQFINGRVQPIYAGSNEIMREIIARGLGLGRSRL